MPSLHQDRTKAIIAERRRKAYEMRIQGASYHQIADTLKVSTDTVRNDVKAHMDYIPRENAIELRDMELDKLNQMELALQKKLRSGSPQAINAAVRIMQHRAQLMGLDSIENNDGLDAAKEAMTQIISALQNGPVATPVEDGQQGD